MFTLQPASGDNPGWLQRLGGTIGGVVGWLFGWLPRGLRASLSLSGEERQTLMSWGLLLGVIVLTAAKLWAQRQIFGHWRAGLSLTIEDKIVSDLFWQLTWDTMLQAALAMGIVAIARGGSMAVSLTRGGLNMDFAASGKAAATLAMDTDVGAAMAQNAEPAAAAVPPPPPQPSAQPAPYAGPDPSHIPPPAAGTPENAPWAH